MRFRASRLGAIFGGAVSAAGVFGSACNDGIPLPETFDPPPADTPYDCPASSNEGPLSPADAGAGDAGIADAGVEPEPGLPGDYSTVEAAVANLAGICARNAELELSDEAECLMSWVTEAEVADSVAALEWSEDEREACRQAVEDVDLCALALDCQDYVFFAANTLINFERDVCFNVKGQQVQCRLVYPCREQQAELEQACVALWSQLCQETGTCQVL